MRAWDRVHDPSVTPTHVLLHARGRVHDYTDIRRAAGAGRAHRVPEDEQGLAAQAARRPCARGRGRALGGEGTVTTLRIDL